MERHRSTDLASLSYSFKQLPSGSDLGGGVGCPSSARAMFRLEQTKTRLSGHPNKASRSTSKAKAISRTAPLQLRGSFPPIRKRCQDQNSNQPSTIYAQRVSHTPLPLISGPAVTEPGPVRVQSTQSDIPHVGQAAHRAVCEPRASDADQFRARGVAAAIPALKVDI